MYSDLDIIYAFVTDSANYSKQSYQKMVEGSVNNVERNYKDYNERTNLDGPRAKMRESLEPSTSD